VGLELQNCRPDPGFYFLLIDWRKNYPDIDVKRGVRFVEGETISIAGGLTSGIDLALRVVERYVGRDVAQRTATYMEYQSRGWIV
jgi:transcriptional regulator GlxA family with amidase domain